MRAENCFPPAWAKAAATRLMKAVERVTADPSLHTPDLGGKATATQVTEAVCEELRKAND